MNTFSVITISLKTWCSVAWQFSLCILVFIVVCPSLVEGRNVFVGQEPVKVTDCCEMFRECSKQDLVNVGGVPFLVETLDSTNPYE